MRPGRNVREIRCKTVLNKVASKAMSFGWSVNPYRGCEHACVYCYARRYHEYMDLGPRRDFETQIFVKVNAGEVLRAELSRPSWRREWVAIGTAVDPYQPVEGRYKVTRSVLEALGDYATPCSIVTKNTMVTRDRQLLRRLAQLCGCRVYFSVTTTDPHLARVIEPDTPPPGKRFEALQALSEAGIDAGVLIAPVLPGLTDTRRSLQSVVQAAAEHGAGHVGAATLRLQGSVRDVYLEFVRSHFPKLLGLYRREYVGEYARRGYQRKIRDLVDELARERGVSKGGTKPLRSAAGGEGDAIGPGIWQERLALQ